MTPTAPVPAAPASGSRLQSRRRKAPRPDTVRNPLLPRDAPGGQIHRKRYPGGEMLLRPGLEQNRELESYVANRDYLAADESRRLLTHNRRCRLYSFHLPAVDVEVILKISWPNPAYPWARRLNLLVSHWLKDYARRAFFGALAFEAHGIPSIRPLACWRHRRSALMREHYFLYERIPADGSLKDWRDRVARGVPDAERAVWHGLLDEAADLMTRIHRCGLRHDDVAPGNFLVASPGASPAPGRGARLYVIDTDRVRRSRMPAGALRRCLDLFDLRRLNLAEADRRRFLRRYLGGEHREAWWRVHDFWRRGWHRPLRKAGLPLGGRPA